MSVPLRKMQNSVAQGENSANIRLNEHLEAAIRHIVQQELREFLLEQRRAALYINSVVERRLGLTTS